MAQLGGRGSGRAQRLGSAGASPSQTASLIETLRRISDACSNRINEINSRELTPPRRAVLPCGPHRLPAASEALPMWRRVAVCLLTALPAFPDSGRVPVQPPAGEPVGTVPSFLNEVVPLLTRHGCNQGACHGKGAGQNGFRLSLARLRPGVWTTAGSPASSTAGASTRPTPEMSLLLRKPTGERPARGRQALRRGQPRVPAAPRLAQGRRAGPKKDEPEVVRLELDARRRAR